MKDKVYIAIDLKSFYASVECIERGLNPLRTNLLVADVTKTEKTICLAVSPSLKAYGISGRARLFEAIQQVKVANATRKAAYHVTQFTDSSWDVDMLKANPSLAIDYIAAPPRMALYREYSSRIVACYLKYVSIDDLFTYSIDEVFIDATPYLGKYKLSGYAFARMLMQDVLETTGITATAGIAENMYLCKIAMDITAKHIPLEENGARIAQLDILTYRRTLWTHKELTDFWMIGTGTANRLRTLGLYTLGDVARCSLENEEVLYREFGKNAQYLIDQAWGREIVSISDIKSYKPQSSSISTGQVLTRPYDFQETGIVVREMIESLVLDLVAKHLMTSQIVLQVGYDIENINNSTRRNAYKGEVVIDHYGRKIPKQARGTVNMGKHTSSTSFITQKVLSLFQDIVDPTLLTRRINLSANHLLSEAEVCREPVMRQLTLFDDPEVFALEKKEKIQKQKEQNMQYMMLELKRRFGSNAILKGTSLQKGATAKERNNTIGGHHA